jgi:hypothetical protein
MGTAKIGRKWISLALRCSMVTCVVFVLSGVARADADISDKPTIAVFPLAGSAPDEDRDHIGFSLRTKLNRDGHYEAISGPEMVEMVAGATGPINLKTSADEVKRFAADAKAAVLIWGEVDGAGEQKNIRLMIMDLRDKAPMPREIDKKINDPTDLRFVAEEILQTIPGVKPFEHPSEISVTLDPESLKLWAKNPNLAPFGDFAEAGHWTAIFASEKYPAPISAALPATDKINIYKVPSGNGENAHNVLAMRMSKDTAENNGLACLSDFIKIEPNMRYRLQYRYKSDGPSLHVFVKGYTTAKGFSGKPEEREIYRRQVPPSGATRGKWVTVLDDLNPQRPGFTVEGLRIDLYAYLAPGVVMFDDVILKAVGKQTDVAVDDAIKK